MINAILFDVYDTLIDFEYEEAASENKKGSQSVFEKVWYLTHHPSLKKANPSRKIQKSLECPP
jgi:FMN phosphatase YigB (HAD superfamily)